MKHGSEYAKRVKRLFHKLGRKFGKPAPAEPTDPLEQMIVGILSDCTTSSKGRAAFRKLCHQMVDMNELRVTPSMELAQNIGDGVPLAAQKAQRIVDLLNDVRRRQDKLDLSFLKQRGRREAREYLESLAGADRASAAGVVLHSLGGHAIGVDDLTLYILRKEELVDPSSDAAEVQGFLERHVSAANAPAFVELLGRFVALHGSRVPVEELDTLLNPPAPEPPEGPREPAQAASSPAESAPAAEKAVKATRKQSTAAKKVKRPTGRAAKGTAAKSKAKQPTHRAKAAGAGKKQRSAARSTRPRAKR